MGKTQINNCKQRGGTQGPGFCDEIKAIVLKQFSELHPASSVARGITLTVCPECVFGELPGSY